MFTLFMNIIRNVPLIIWLFAKLPKLKAFRRDMRRCSISGEPEKERAAILAATSCWGKMVCEKLQIALMVEGEASLPEGPVVLASNHESYVDIPVLFAAITSKQFGFVAKNNLSHLPVFGKWIRDIRSIFIKRDDARASLEAINSGVGLLKRGYSLAVFPEGTRSKGGGMREFKNGSLRLATKPGVPVVPITLDGTWHVLEKKGKLQKNLPVRVFIHPPIETSSMPKREAAALADTVERIIRQKLSEWHSQ